MTRSSQHIGDDREHQKLAAGSAENRDGSFDIANIKRLLKEGREGGKVAEQNGID